MNKDVQAYINTIPEERKEHFMRLFDAIRNNLPEGFEETISYGMIGWVVPKTTYPAGYHCDPKLALPFLSLASQKNFIAVYHMGIYVNPELMEWFTSEFTKVSKLKLDMGKSCIRFKKTELIPVELMGELAKKMSPQDWIARYERLLKK
jgi:uncharacterized protein YdhG (YjbR/CyaY superfamily)